MTTPVDYIFGKGLSRHPVVMLARPCSVDSIFVESWPPKHFTITCPVVVGKFFLLVLQVFRNQVADRDAFVSLIGRPGDKRSAPREPHRSSEAR